MEQRSPEWFEARKGRVTASLVGAILGLSPYMTRADAMRVMVREALGAEREFKGNVATEYGTFHEKGACIDFQMETGITVEPAPFVEFEDWAGASPDGWTSDGGILEIKCPYSQRDKNPPEFSHSHELAHYYAQMQFQLIVTGKPFCHLWQWAPKGTCAEIVPVDPEWAAENLPRIRQFHAEFLHEMEHNADDHLAPKRVEIDTPEAHRMLAEWDEISEQLERAAERKKDLLAELVGIAGEKNALIAGRKLTSVERKGAVSYAKVVKDHCPKVDLEPYRGKPSQYWQVA